MKIPNIVAFLLVAAFAAPAFTILPGDAKADPAKDFLDKMSGSYSGSGVARIVGDKKDKVSCKLNNSFDAASNQLVIKGNCASVKGKGSVNGTIKNEAGKLTGSFVSNRNVTVTQSNGIIRNGKMILSISAIDNKTGQLSKIRQVISPTQKGFAADFFVYDNKTSRYEDAGSLALRKR